MVLGLFAKSISADRDTRPRACRRTAVARARRVVFANLAERVPARGHARVRAVRLAAVGGTRSVVLPDLAKPVSTRRRARPIRSDRAAIRGARRVRLVSITERVATRRDTRTGRATTELATIVRTGPVVLVGTAHSIATRALVAEVVALGRRRASVVETCDEQHDTEDTVETGRSHRIPSA